FSAFSIQARTRSPGIAPRTSTTSPLCRAIIRPPDAGFSIVRSICCPSTRLIGSAPRESRPSPSCYRAASDMIDTIRQDVVYGVRGSHRSRAFTLIALLVLAFGIAANTTVFSVVNAVLLRPLPVSKPEDLRFLNVVFVRLSNLRHNVPYRTVEQLAQRRDVFSGVAAFFGDGAKIGNGASASRVVGERVPNGYFDVLGVHAALGRTFVPLDDEPGADPVIVISDRFWRTRLDGDPNVLGRTIDLRAQFTNAGTYLRHHRLYTIVGVMPPVFQGLTTVWVPR